MKRSLHTRPLPHNYRRITEPVRLPEEAAGLTTGLSIAIPVAFALFIVYSAYSGRSLSPMSWYLARAAGITLYLLLWGAVVTGLLLTTRLFDSVVSKATLYSVHSYLGRLAYAYLAAHLLSLIIDQHLPFSIEQLVVPFEGPASEPWTGFGIVGMYLFIVVVASASMRRYIPYSFWRFLHILAFPMYALSLIHGLGAGSSSDVPIMQAVYLLTSCSVLLLCLVRVAVRRPGRQNQPMGWSARPLDRLGGQTTLPPAPGERNL